MWMSGKQDIQALKHVNNTVDGPKLDQNRHANDWD